MAMPPRAEAVPQVRHLPLASSMTQALREIDAIVQVFARKNPLHFGSYETPCPERLIQKIPPLAMQIATGQ